MILDICKKNNIEVRFTLTLGYGCEDDITIKDTISLLNKLKPNALAIYLLKIYPGTALYEKAKKEKFITDEWWFDNTQDAPFYTKYFSQKEFLKIKFYLISKLNASIESVYKEDRDDGEYYLKWS